MVLTNINDIKNSAVLKIENELWKVLEFQHIKPGKGGAFVRIKMHNILNNKIVQKTVNSGSKIDIISMDTKNAMYLYADDIKAYFMDNQTLEQYDIDLKILEGKMVYLVEQKQYDICFYENKPLYVKLPDSVILKVIETQDVGNTGRVVNDLKSAILENNIETLVPTFINIGDTVKISTENNKYINKV